MADGTSQTRVTLQTVRKWAAAGDPFAMLTCYDATTARWLWRGGVRTMLVGDTAAHVILGHDSTLPAEMDFMLTLTAAVRRGAPDAFIMADMPFGSYQCGDDEGVRNAVAFMKHAGADVVKLEVETNFASLVGRMSTAGVPVVAHLGSTPQHVRARGRYRTRFKCKADVDRLLDTTRAMIDHGAVMLLLEAVPDEVARAVVELATRDGEPIPVIGCGAGAACHGHVVVLHDLLGLTDWHPPFAPPLANLGEQVRDAAARWVDDVQAGRYLRDGGPYAIEGS